MKFWLWPIVLSAVACAGRTSTLDMITPEDIAAGEYAFSANGCRTCHGQDGRGDGPLADSLDPRPRDFVDASAFQAPRTVTSIAATIAAGVPSRPMPMPPFDHLDERTRRQLAAWILSRASSAASAADSAKEHE